MRNFSLNLLRLTAFFLSLIILAPSSFCFDFPLTENSIREAYFLGTRQGGGSLDIFKQYSRGIDELHQGNCVSKARIETPFLQVAEYAGSLPNYSAQDAVKELSSRPMSVRLFADICYMPGAPPPNSIKFRFIQNKKDILPVTDVRSAFAERFNNVSFLLPNGESVELEFNPKQLDSSTLTMLIDTPNGQHAETAFDLRTLR